MNDLKTICLDEMELLDMRLRQLGSAAGMASQAALSLGDSDYSDMFGHMKNCLDNMRAEVDDLRGAMLQTLMAEKTA